MTPLLINVNVFGFVTFAVHFNISWVHSGSRIKTNLSPRNQVNKSFVIHLYSAIFAFGLKTNQE